MEKQDGTINLEDLKKKELQAFMAFSNMKCMAMMQMVLENQVHILSTLNKTSVEKTVEWMDQRMELNFDRVLKELNEFPNQSEDYIFKRGFSIN